VLSFGSDVIISVITKKDAIKHSMIREPIMTYQVITAMKTPYPLLLRIQRDFASND
jgi:hypothetical protein